MKMNLTKLGCVIIACAAMYGCGNASMKQLNPAGGTVTLYAADGSVIAKYETDGKPEMSDGGHLYLRDRNTKRLVIVYGTYTFEEKP